MFPGISGIAGFAAAEAAAFTPASLFTGGEIGDYWRFDNVHTDQTTVGGNISTATGIVSGRVMSSAGTSPKLASGLGGNLCMQTAGGGGSRMSHAFGTTLSQPGTIIICMGAVDGSNAHAYATGSSTTSRWQISCDSSGNIIGFAGATLDSTLNNPFGTRLMTFEFNGSSGVIRYNGTQIASGDMGTQSTDQLTLGALWDGTFAVYPMSVYSVLIINRLLTSMERDNAERFLGAHAGLTW